ncbi:unnamed protein product [Clavelina lepadiformis]|uniref:Uncharacterized protein n=1 Tax=Clavelina lepadiformis TaxID=159417 RepID=A0ABP0F8L2_CLALP
MLAGQDVSNQLNDSTQNVAVSDESDDLDTALQMWKKLFPSSFNGSANKDLEGKKCEEKLRNESRSFRTGHQKGTRVISSQQAFNIVSTDSDDSLQGSTVIVKRSSKSRTKMPATRRKNPCRKRTEVSDTPEISEFPEHGGQEERKLSDSDDRAAATNRRKKRRTKTGARKPKRRKVWSPRVRTPRVRKLPLQFIESPEHSPPKVLAENTPPREGSDEEEPFSGETTQLLETPDSELSEVPASDEEQTGVRCQSGQENLSTSPRNLDDKFPVIDDVAKSPIPGGRLIENPQNFFEKTSTPVDQSSKMSSLESTALDEIFFDTIKASPKKPPPRRISRRHRPQKDDTLATLPDVVEPNCGISEYTTLWDDDSLWTSSK